jgi:hypothetical protein
LVDTSTLIHYSDFWFSSTTICNFMLLLQTTTTFCQVVFLPFYFIFCLLMLLGQCTNFLAIFFPCCWTVVSSAELSLQIFICSTWPVHKVKLQFATMNKFNPFPNSTMHWLADTDLLAIPMVRIIRQIKFLIFYIHDAHTNKVEVCTWIIH